MYDMTYCCNYKCNNDLCMRHYTKIPKNQQFISMAEFPCIGNTEWNEIDDEDKTEEKE